MRKDNAIIALQEKVRKLTLELEWVKGSQHRAPRYWELDINPIDIAYVSSHKDHEDRGITLEEEDLLGMILLASKSKNYIDWV